MMDGIFGHQNFQNEVIWKRSSAHSSEKRWRPVHDVILFYTASEKHVWNKVYVPYYAAYLKRYRNVDSTGKPWSDHDLTGPGIRNGYSGQVWKGYNPTDKGLHWKVSHNTVVEFVGDEQAGRMNTIEKLDLLDSKGRIHWPKCGGFPRFKRYVGLGLPIQDIVTDVSPLNSQSQERLGYPTQKSIALLDRIIQASSNKGQVVFDPFCGCETTIYSAQKTIGSG